MNSRSIRLIRVVWYLALLIAFSLFCSTRVAFAEPYDDEMPDNGIPVAIINVDESQGTIDAMIASEDHSVYCYGTFSVVVPDGFHYSDFPDTPCESIDGISMSIRGRGNSTWQNKGKKPFKIKLDTKTDVLGLGRNKHWVLVANAFDSTLMRDRITGWLGDEMGFEFTPRGVSGISANESTLNASRIIPMENASLHPNLSGA